MIIYRVLDEVFRNWSHVAVLRALLDTTSGYTGNEVARKSGMHPRSALKALTSLEHLGIVDRQRGGRDHIFTLNHEHYLVRQIIVPVYTTEREFLNEISDVIRKKIKRSVLNATIFGSVAIKIETPMSDLDICCIVKNEIQKGEARNRLNANSQMLFKTYGIKIAPILFTIKEVKAKVKTPLVQDIMTNGISIVGKKIRTLLYV